MLSLNLETGDHEVVMKYQLLLGYAQSSRIVKGGPRQAHPSQTFLCSAFMNV